MIGGDNTRWVIKKASRRALMLGSWASGMLKLQGLINSGQLRTITYHRFGPWPKDPFCVESDIFEAQVRWAAEKGLAVSLADLEAFLRGERALPSGAVMFTCDDGAQSVFDTAAPILKRYGVPMVAYVTTAAVGAKASQLGQAESFMSWDDLGRLADYGITLGSHGHTHKSLGVMSEQEVKDEAELSRDAIQRQLGITVTSFAYPYGTPAHYSEMTARVLHRAGYSTIFTSTHGSISKDSNPLVLRRVKVEGGEPLWQFKLLVRGGMDGWRAVDTALSMVETARRRRARAQNA